MAWSDLKPTEKFEFMWAEHGFRGSDITKELVFDEELKYRFDYAFPSAKLAIEIHGFGFGHQSIHGLKDDCTKIRHAIMLGWCVLPFTQSCIATKDGALDAVHLVCEMLVGRLPRKQD